MASLHPLSSWSGPLPPTTSLQDVLSIKFDNTLFTNGCNQTDGAANCTAACQDSSQAFRTLESFHNCVLYMNIADFYAADILSSNDTKLADGLVIQKSALGSPTSQNVNSTITKCFDAYCDDRPDCKKLMWKKYWTSNASDPYDLFLYSNVYRFYQDADALCGYIARPSPLNSDIGGIGVYASYWIQSGLALLGTFLVLLWGWGTHYIYLPNMVRRRGTNATKTPNGVSATFVNRRLAHLTVALTDFQKAQCFFMLAVNIAALANTANGGLLPVSLQQLYDNHSVLASVAISGSLPITATLLALNLVDMISGYLLALSGCTVAFSIATVATMGNFKPSRGDLESIQAQASKGMSQCGGLDLSVYCLQYQENDPSYIYVWGIMAYCLIVLLYIFAYHHNAFRDPLNNQTRPWVLRMVSCLSAIRTLQVAFTILAALAPFPLGMHSEILAFSTVAYLALLPLCRLRCAKRIDSTRFISIRCGFELLAWVLWLASFASRWNPFIFSLWVTFSISSVQLLRGAYVKDTKIRKWTLMYRQFAYRDETLPTSSLGSRSIRTHLWTFFTIIVKASIILITLIFMRIDNLEKRAASHDWARKFRRFLVIFLYWIIFLGCIVSFAFNFLGLASFQAKVDIKTWTFGQIVAITVWAPPLCEYFHLELLGMTRYFRLRLLPPYSVSATVTTAQPVP